MWLQDLQCCWSEFHSKSEAADRWTCRAARLRMTLQTEASATPTGRVTHKLMGLPSRSALALVSVIVRYLYLYPKVLVPFAQESVHILQHQLSCSIQQVKVKEEAQQ